MRKLCTKMVPEDLTTEQKASWRDVCLDLLDRLEREPEFFSCVITGDEYWILEYDPQTKHQSREWHTANSPHPKKARISKSKIKSMLICFFDSQRIIHKEFVPPGQTVNQTFYRKVLERLRKMVGGTCATRHCTHLDAAPRQCPMSHGSLHQWIFGRKKHSCGSSAPPIRQISVPVTYFYSPGSKTTWKGAILVLRIISRRA